MATGLQGESGLAVFVVAVTGASGAIYGVRLIEELLRRGDDVEVIISPSGFLLLKEELGMEPGTAPEATAKALLGHLGIEPAKARLKCHSASDLGAPMASGSSLRRVMVVCPCSMGTLSRIATGASTNLIERTADCVLKERGTLVLVPRETPLNSIHLENMLKLSGAGAVILPAMPGFYHGPKTIDDLVGFVVGKVLDAVGIENSLYKRWSGPAK